MPRRGLDHGRVVAEAAALADAEGVEAVTLAAVAARLDVRAPSLYKHVAGLDALRGSLAVLAAGELTDAVARAIAGRAGADGLRAAGRAWVGYARTHPGRYALTVRAPAADDPDLRAVAERGGEVLRATLRATGLEGEELTHAVRAVRSALHGFCAIEAGDGFGLALDHDDSLERLLDVLARGLGLAG